MVQNVLRDIGGVGIYGAISICLFFSVFTGAVLWAFAQRKAVLKAASLLPLDEDNTKRSSHE